MNEQTEEICVQRFLKWYNENNNRNYVHKRAEDYFTELKDKPRWDFVAYERDNLEEWIGVEIKDLSTVIEVHRWSEFWDKFCLELTRDLVASGIEGRFKIMHLPVLHLKSKERQNF